MSVKKSEKRDGFQNMLTGHGTVMYDSSESTSYVGEVNLSQQELSDLFRYSGLAKRIVTRKVYDCFKEGFEIDGDKNGDIKKKMKKIRAVQRFSEAVEEADAFGGSLILVGVNDGKELIEPVGSYSEVSFLRVYSRFDVSIASYYDDPKSENYAEPQTYLYQGAMGSVTIHHSRVVRVDGVRLTKRELVDNGGWHDSVYQSMFKELRRVGTSYQHAERAIGEMYIYVMKIQDLIGQLSSGVEGEQDILKRLMSNDMTRSMLNMIAVDAEYEELTRDSISLSGLTDVITKLEESLSSVSGIPYSLLLGSAPKGLSTGDDTGLTFYYDNIKAKQLIQVESPLEELIGFFTPSDLGTGFVTFNPLDRMSPKDEADVRKTHSETMKNFYDMGALFPDEIRDSVFGGEYSNEITIDAELDPMTEAQLSKLEV